MHQQSCAHCRLCVTQHVVLVTRLLKEEGPGIGLISNTGNVINGFTILRLNTIENSVRDRWRPGLCIVCWGFV